MVNVASGVPVADREVVGLLAREMGAEDRVAYGALATPSEEPAELWADVRRLREAVGVPAGRPLAEGLRQTLAWWLARPLEGGRAGTDPSASTQRIVRPL